MAVPRSRKRKPIGFPASLTVANVRSGKASSHAQARPIAPKRIPIQNATGMMIAPTMDTCAVTPGRPSALETGANITCRVMKGMAKARTVTNGAISSHFSPNSVATSGSAATAMPK